MWHVALYTFLLSKGRARGAIALNDIFLPAWLHAEVSKRGEWGNVKMY